MERERKQASERASEREKGEKCQITRDRLLTHDPIVWLYFAYKSCSYGPELAS